MFIKQRLYFGTDTAKYIVSLVHVISDASTHRQGPTAKAVYDYCQSILPTITAGSGIGVTGTSPNYTITNTGDTDPSDDITDTTNAGGDLDGLYPDPTVIGLQTRPISASAPDTGQVLKWNGTTWAPAADDGGSGHILQDEGVGVVPRDTIDYIQTANINVTLSDNAGKTEFRAIVRPNSLTDSEIATAAIGTDEIADASILGGDINQNGAGTGEVLKWNGSTWAPSADNGGSGHILQDEGVGVVPRDTIDYIQTANINVTLSDNAGKTEFRAIVRPNSLTDSEIATAAIGTDEIADASILGGDINQNGAGTGEVLKWNGSTWAPAADDGGATNITYDDNGGQNVDINSSSGSGINIQGLSGISIYDDGGTLAFEYTGPTGIEGSIANQQVAFGSPSNEITGSADLLWTGDALRVGPALIEHGTGQRTFQKVGSNMFFAESGNDTNSGADDNIAFGRDALTFLTSADRNAAIGTGALGNVSTGNENIGIGAFAGDKMTTGTSIVAIGPNAVRYNTGSYNIGIGRNALFGVNAVSTGQYNVGIGYNSLFALTTGTYNVGIGYLAANNLTSGAGNTAIGREVLTKNTTASNNTALGYRCAQSLVTAGDNSIFGSETGYYTTGVGNTFVGRRAGLGVSPSSTGVYNTTLGFETMKLYTTGAYNIAIGYRAGDQMTTGQNNILIGRDVEVSALTASSELRIASLLYGTSITSAAGLFGVGIVAPEAKAHILGTGATSATYSLITTSSTGNTATPTLCARDDDRVGIKTNAPAEALDVNGQGRFDAIDLRNWTAGDNNNTGEITFRSGSPGNAPYLTVGDGERLFPVATTELNFQAIDYDVTWTAGRTRAFWTVPARYAGWKIYRVSLSVSSIGAGSIIEVEKGGVAQATRTIDEATELITLDSVIAADEIWTFDITTAGTAKGLNVTIQLSKQ